MNEINHFEQTKDGVIDWKMEADRANRLLESYERKYSQAIEPTDIEDLLKTLITEGRISPNTARQMQRLDRVDAALAKRVGDHIRQVGEFKLWLTQWLLAYNTDIFPEPDLKKAAEVLTANGMTIDSLSAEMGRHVLTRVIARLDAPPDD